MTAKPVPFVDPPRKCRCGYCADAKVREFIDGGLEAAREQGLPKPHESTVYDCYVEEFGPVCVSASSIGTWLKTCCKAWYLAWPGQPDG